MALTACLAFVFECKDVAILSASTPSLILTLTLYNVAAVCLSKRGVITDLAPAKELAEKIQGKVWEIDCQSDEVQTLQNKYRVIKIASNESDVTLCVLSDIIPEGNARSVTPTLEDYYLWVFGDAK